MPVLMLTARGEEADRIVGIEMVPTIIWSSPSARASCWRASEHPASHARPAPNLRPESQRCLVFAGWRLDTATRALTAPDGVMVPLSGGEYRLLRILLEHPNGYSIATAGGADPWARAEPMTRHRRQVSRLRQRLRDEHREPQLIQTVRGEACAGDQRRGHGIVRLIPFALRSPHADPGHRPSRCPVRQHVAAHGERTC